MNRLLKTLGENILIAIGVALALWVWHSWDSGTATRTATAIRGNPCRDAGLTYPLGGYYSAKDCAEQIDSGRSAGYSQSVWLRKLKTVQDNQRCTDRARTDEGRDACDRQFPLR
jgi:hypothetical protein